MIDQDPQAALLTCFSMFWIKSWATNKCGTILSSKHFSEGRGLFLYWCIHVITRKVSMIVMRISAWKDWFNYEIQ